MCGNPVRGRRMCGRGIVCGHRVCGSREIMTDLSSPFFVNTIRHNTRLIIPICLV